MRVMEAIRKRRSIRKFKSTPVTGEQLELLIEAARLAPSGSNVQPWRFIVVTDQAVKDGLRDAAFGLRFVGDAPVVIVCCGDLRAWKQTREHNQEILKRVDIPLTKEYRNALTTRVERAVTAKMDTRIPTTIMNVAIAVEHIVLTAVELGLGSCWVRTFNATKVRRLLELPENIHVIALLPVGVPDEEPTPRPRLTPAVITLHANAPNF